MLGGAPGTCGGSGAPWIDSPSLSTSGNGTRGSSHLRTSVSKGLEIIENLRGHTSGYAIPQYVIDGPGGGGKIPINPNYVVARTPDSIVLRNYKGDIYEYPEVAPADKTTPEPTPIYRHLEFLDPIEEREEITSRSWRAPTSKSGRAFSSTRKTSRSRSSTTPSCSGSAA